MQCDIFKQLCLPDGDGATPSPSPGNECMLLAVPITANLFLMPTFFICDAITRMCVRGFFTFAHILDQMWHFCRLPEAKQLRFIVCGLF